MTDPNDNDSDIDYSLSSTVDDSQSESDMSMYIPPVCRLNYLCRKSNLANEPSSIHRVTGAAGPTSSDQFTVANWARLVIGETGPICHDLSDQYSVYPNSSDQCLAAISTALVNSETIAMSPDSRDQCTSVTALTIGETSAVYYRYCSYYW